MLMKRKIRITISQPKDSQKMCSFKEVTQPTTATPTTTLGGDLHGYSQITNTNNGELPQPDVEIVTSGGLRIPAHSSILASASSVLGKIIDKPSQHGSPRKAISILGVPCDAVSVFLRFIYSARCTQEEMEKYGIHLLALSHVYLIPHLKQRCSKDVGQELTIENVVDVLQLARLCDAPHLHLNCMKFISNHFKSVEKTEGWKFMENHDPFLELEILQFIDEAEMRKKRTRRQRQEQRLYVELNEAMECLEHICTEGCTSVGPYHVQPCKKRVPCGKFSTCQGLQLLIKHFATCKNRVNGGCFRCKQMWQLLRLHSSICDQPDSCGVPLCWQFKLKMKQEKKSDDALWKLLVRKVVSARVMASLSLPKNEKRAEQLRAIQEHGIKAFPLESK